MTRKAKVEALEKFAFRKRRKHSNDIDETRGEDETPGEDEPESSANVNESAAPQNEGVALDDETNKILEINREVQSSNSFRPPHICKEKGGFFREKYSAVCIPCFDKQLLCSHSLEIPLRLILIGHNPSKHAWASGNFYSNPSNRMWKLLFEASVMPSLMDRERRNKASQENPNDEVRWLRPGEKRWWTIAISDETEKRGNLSNRSASELGIGFTDIGTRPGNDASTYDRKTMLLWGEDLLNRFRNHIERIKLTLKYLRRQSGCSEEEQNVTDEEASPAIVAFTGKRQFSQVSTIGDSFLIYAYSVGTAV